MDYVYETDGNLLDVKLNQAVIEKNTYGQRGSMPRRADEPARRRLISTDYVYDTHGRQTLGGSRQLDQFDFNLPKQVTQSGQISVYLRCLRRAAKKTGPSSATFYVGELYEKRFEGRDRATCFMSLTPKVASRRFRVRIRWDR